MEQQYFSLDTFFSYTAEEIKNKYSACPSYAYAPFRVSTEDIHGEIENIIKEHPNVCLREYIKAFEECNNKHLVRENNRFTAFIWLVLIDKKNDSGNEQNSNPPFNLSKVEYEDRIIEWLNLLLFEAEENLKYLIPVRSRDKHTHGEKPYDILEKEVTDLFFKTEREETEKEVRVFFKEKERRQLLKQGYLFFLRRYNFERAYKIKKVLDSREDSDAEQPIKKWWRKIRLWLSVSATFYIRLWTSIILGSIVICLPPEGWKVYSLLVKLPWFHQLPILLVTTVGSFSYLYYETGKKVERLSEKERRALRLFLPSFCFGVVFFFLFAFLAKEIGTLKGDMDIFAGVLMGGLFMLLGIIIQVIWEDKSLTEPV